MPRLSFTDLHSDLLSITVSFLKPHERIPLCFVAKRLRQLHAMRFVLGKEIYRFAAEQAAKRNHFALLQWMHSHVSTCLTPKTTLAAAKGGHQELLLWLRNKAQDWDEAAMAGAAQGGHLGV